MIDNNVLAVGCMLLVMLLYIKCSSNMDGFESKPTPEQANKMAEQMSSNKDKFNSLDRVRRHMPWMDAITYEDSRRLIQNGNFNKQNILDILG